MIAPPLSLDLELQLGVIHVDYQAPVQGAHCLGTMWLGCRALRAACGHGICGLSSAASRVYSGDTRGRVQGPRVRVRRALGGSVDLPCGLV